MILGLTIIFVEFHTGIQAAAKNQHFLQTPECVQFLQISA